MPPPSSCRRAGAAATALLLALKVADSSHPLASIPACADLASGDKACNLRPPPVSSPSSPSPAPPLYPVVADKELDCAVRATAWNFSRLLQPSRGPQQDVFDALQLETYCGISPPPPPSNLVGFPPTRASAVSSSSQGPNFYVDAGKGSDANPGTFQLPFETIQHGVDSCRSSRSPSQSCTLTLRGTAPFVFSQPLLLDSRDSGLVVAAYAGESPVVSGAFSLATITWQPFNTTNGANVWVSRSIPLPGGGGSTTTPLSLFVDGVRMIRARWPNANPETAILPEGYSNATSWLPPNPPPSPPVDIPGNYSRTFDHFFPSYSWGTGGAALGHFEPPEGHWISTSPEGGSTYAVPSGFLFDPSRFSPRAGSWSAASVSGAVVHVFHGIYWGGWSFNLSSFDAAKGVAKFAQGGWQEARGATVGGGLYVDNVLEELDAPGEWFFDPRTNDLYLWHNATSGTPPPADGGVAVSQVDELFILNGSASQPIANVSFVGVTFTGTQPTFLSRRFRAPSGGDWSFAETAAIVARGTSGFSVEGCTFDRLGGNGILLSGWNRDASVLSSTFRRLGDNAIVSCGNADGQDLSRLDVPANTLVDGCMFSDLGIYVKQSGAYYAALSANATIRNSVAFNLPRAAVNINDGAFGGHTIERNLFFNAVRETADHGPLNSWDRDPYIQPGRTNPDGSPVLLPSPSVVRGCFFINNYFSIHPLDHDDGSNSFLDEGNVVAFAGTKNFEGFGKLSVGNLFVRPDFETPTTASSPPQIRQQPVTPDGIPLPVAYYFPACARSVGQWTWGQALADVYANNTCILAGTGANGTQPASPFLFGSCNSAAPGSDGQVPLASGNTYFTPQAQLLIKCGSKSLTLAEAQAVGYEVGSVARDGGGLGPQQIASMIGQWLGM